MAPGKNKIRDAGIEMTVYMKDGNATAIAISPNGKMIAIPYTEDNGIHIIPIP